MYNENIINTRKAYCPSLVILAVEDYMPFSRDITHALPEHRVVLARSVEEAKLRFDEFMPDLTFLDIDLPDGPGFEVLDHIRQKDPSAYVVMITGSKVESDVLASRNKGARGYIIKPFTQSKIEQHLSQFLEYRKKQDQYALAMTQARRGKGITPGATLLK